MEPRLLQNEAAMATKTPHAIGRLMAMMALYVIIGTPMVGYLWETLNQILALQVDLLRLAVSVPVLLAWLGLLYLMARSIRRW